MKIPFSGNKPHYLCCRTKQICRELSLYIIIFDRVITGKDKVRENTGNLEILPKHRENRILYAQVVNSRILKIKDIAIFSAKLFNFFLEVGYVCQDEVMYKLVTNH